jgi:hypothetical protein
MMQRCYNPKQESYRNYGARGIAVCEDWHDVREFVRWVSENLGPRPEGASFDRINNDGNYEPGNVQWATWKEQTANRRSIQALQRQIDSLNAEMARMRGGEAMPTHSSES